MQNDATCAIRTTLNVGDTEKAPACQPILLKPSAKSKSPAHPRLPVAGGEPWTATSLFCGGGGLDIGFLRGGVRATAAYDNSRSALLTYDANLPGTGRLADLSRVLPDDRCDILLAGAPCQGFSTAGKRLAGDPRNALLGRIGDVALRTRPRVVVVENVPAAISERHGGLWQSLEGRLRLAGYNTATVTLHGEESGLAQRRRRLFMLCWLGCNETTLRIDAVTAPTLRHTLKDVASAEDHDPAWPAPGSPDAAIASHMAPGQKLCNVRSSPNAVPTWSIPEVFGRVSQGERAVLEAVRVLRRRERVRDHGDGDPVDPDRLADFLGRDVTHEIGRLIDAAYLRTKDGGVEFRNTYNGKFRRLSWDDPSPTVDTHFGRMALFVHPDEDRGLSVREAARIQGFPDDYRLAGNPRDRFEVIGNAVPPPMAGRLARFVREAILKR